LDRFHGSVFHLCDLYDHSDSFDISFHYTIIVYKPQGKWYELNLFAGIWCIHDPFSNRARRGPFGFQPWRLCAGNSNVSPGILWNISRPSRIRKEKDVDEKSE
jgi:hypothetical protein